MAQLESITSMPTDADSPLSTLKHHPSATPSKLQNILWYRYGIKYDAAGGDDLASEHGRQRLLEFYCRTVKTQQVLRHEQYCGKKHGREF